MGVQLLMPHRRSGQARGARAGPPTHRLAGPPPRRYIVASRHIATSPFRHNPGLGQGHSSQLETE